MKPGGIEKMKMLFVIIAMIGCGLVVAGADDDDDDGDSQGDRGGNKQGHYIDGRRKDVLRELPLIQNPKWKTECASCHMLYHPGLLPARSWSKMMTGLENHFGENAALVDPTKKEITDFLIQNAADRTMNRRSQKIGNSIPGGEIPLRISETRYFLRKHDELNSNIYKRKAIGSAANCVACHKNAEKGYFNEREVRIPK